MALRYFQYKILIPAILFGFLENEHSWEGGPSF